MADDRLLWITDPWDTLDHPRDTTLRLIEEAVRLGVPCCWSDVRTIRWRPDGADLLVHEVVGVAPERGREAFDLIPVGRRSPREFSLVLYRPDPPVDQAYLHPLQLLVSELGSTPPGCRSEIVNPPAVLLSASEKLLAGLDPGLMPPSLVATEWEALSDFGRHEQLTVVKPLCQAQSKGVELLRWTTAAERERARAVLLALTDEFRRPVLLQRYLAEVLEGETRLWFVDGELVAAARKQPAQGTFCIDMDKGGRLVAHALTAAERLRATRITAVLRRLGIRLAAVDLIAGFVTDFNVTSPGLLPAMEALTGQNLGRAVIRGLLRRPAERATPRDRPGAPALGCR